MTVSHSPLQIQPHLSALWSQAQRLYLISPTAQRAALLLLLLAGARPPQTPQHSPLPAEGQAREGA